MERLLFGLPSDLEACLAATAAVQSFVAEQHKQMRRAEAQIVKFPLHIQNKLHAELLARTPELHLANLSAHWLLPAFAQFSYFDEVENKSYQVEYQVIQEEKYDAVRGKWEFAHCFDVETAYRLGAPTERHMAVAFSVMIGANAGAFPSLASISVPAPTIDVLLLANDWDGASKIAQFIESHHPELKFTGTYDPDLELISRAKMVVGLRSGWTYLASILRRKVVELYPNDRYKRWLSKWSNPNYRMIYGDTFAPELVWRSMEELWTRSDLVMVGLESKTQMEQQTSIVSGADELYRAVTTP